MLRMIRNVAFGMALLALYIALMLIVLAVVVWQKITRRERSPDLSGTDDDPY